MTNIIILMWSQELFSVKDRHLFAKMFKSIIGSTNLILITLCFRQEFLLINKLNGIILSPKMKSLNSKWKTNKCNNNNPNPNPATLKYLARWDQNVTVDLINFQSLAHLRISKSLKLYGGHTVKGKGKPRVKKSIRMSI